MNTQRLLSLSRLILPIAFFGYGGFVNYEILTGDRVAMDRAEGSLIKGEVSASLGSQYARAMPHREPAVAWLGAARYLLAGEGRDGVMVGQDGWLFTDEELVLATEADMDRVVSEIVAAQARLQAMGSRLVLMPLPAKIDVYRDHAPDQELARAMEAQYDRFLERLAAVSIDAVDTRTALIEAAARTPVFLQRDTHWTPDGAMAVAAAVAESGLVPSGETSFVERDGEPQEITGDLVSFVTDEAMAPRIGLGPEKILPFVAEASEDAAGGIFATDAPLVGTYLVGTSYSANESWSFAPALMLALERDVLNFAEQGRGPVRPMRVMLDDPSLTQNPPELVLWEFPIRYLGDPSIWPDDLRADADAALQGSL
ncbi:hypothetical protein FHG66_07735 [Rubellimicrobium rubrum]|uniref:AlgX/AlgJ SGNH hydrolase-like domain-containing protein n=1 Tax=Rubellimicrobium rubrum TaxID=2585369 RepID=A0A5C4N0H1_9RHOB|nr:hypothetical protein [Rubellimicrobium rubrum]TNC50851.1 hypothetical protein FHG66_07735 [Rubellimicrobium rubrum]